MQLNRHTWNACDGRGVGALVDFGIFVGTAFLGTLFICAVCIHG